MTDEGQAGRVRCSCRQFVLEHLRLTWAGPALHWAQHTLPHLICCLIITRLMKIFWCHGGRSQMTGTQRVEQFWDNFNHSSLSHEVKMKSIVSVVWEPRLNNQCAEAGDAGDSNLSPGWTIYLTWSNTHKGRKMHWHWYNHNDILGGSFILK